MHTRTRFIPIMEAKVGMTLAAPISLTNHGRLSLKLAKDFHLNALSIDQLVAHGAEYIAVIEPDVHTEEQVMLENDAAIQRVQEIFSGADISNPTTAELFRQILRYRSTS